MSETESPPSAGPEPKPSESKVELEVEVEAAEPPAPHPAQAFYDSHRRSLSHSSVQSGGGGEPGVDASAPAAAEPPGAIRSGWLQKRGQLLKTWKRRFFELTERALVCYADQDRRLRKGEEELTAESEVEEANVRPNCFCLVNGARRVYLSASSNVEKLSWMELITAAINSAREERESVSQSWRIFETVDEAQEKVSSIIAHRKDRPKILIKVGQARGLAGKDRSGTSSPYATIRIGRASVKTQVRRRTLSPFWGEIFILDQDPKARLATVEVFDWDQLSRDRFLGRVVVPLNTPPNIPTARWFSLGKRSSKSNVCGEIHLTLLVTAPPGPQAQRALSEVQGLEELRVPILPPSFGRTGHPTHLPHPALERVEDFNFRVQMQCSAYAGLFRTKGTLVLTNYRLVFISDLRQRPRGDGPELVTEVPVRCIASAKVSNGRSLKLRCRDGRTLTFHFIDMQEAPPSTTLPFTFRPSASPARRLRKASVKGVFPQRRGASPLERDMWMPSSSDVEASEGEDLVEVAPETPLSSLYARLHFRVINPHIEQAMWVDLHRPLLEPPETGPRREEPEGTQGEMREQPEEVRKTPSGRLERLLERTGLKRLASGAGGSGDGAEIEVSPSSPAPQDTQALSQPPSTSEPAETQEGPTTGAAFDAAHTHTAAGPLLCGWSRQFLGESGWGPRDLMAEYHRLGLPDAKWKITRINEAFAVCASYPPLLVVPSSIADDFVRAAAACRSKGRLPVLTWRHKGNLSSMCRSSQPLVGMKLFDSNEDDLVLLMHIHASSGPQTDMPPPLRENTNDEDLTRLRSQDSLQLMQRLDKEGPAAVNRPAPAAQGYVGMDGRRRERFVVIDARPELNARANQAAGMGFENTPQYKQVCQVLFTDIGNIHVMRRSLDTLQELCHARDVSSPQFGASAEATRWLLHLHKVLLASLNVANLLHHHGTSVLVHCSDGWDRTAQLCATAQLLLDPYYRTISGFQVLVQKEWCSFGHKFATRSGADGPADRSPIFHQWLDCVHQIQRQLPWAFEFDEALLLFVATHVDSGWFGNFLHDSERERFTSRAYRAERSLESPMLTPVVSLKRLVLWDAWFFRWQTGLYDTAWRTGQGPETLKEEGEYFGRLAIGERVGDIADGNSDGSASSSDDSSSSEDSGDGGGRDA